MIRLGLQLAKILVMWYYWHDVHTHTQGEVEDVEKLPYLGFWLILSRFSGCAILFSEESWEQTQWLNAKENLALAKIYSAN
jgi:hypothetical protein